MAKYPRLANFLTFNDIGSRLINTNNDDGDQDEQDYHSETDNESMYSEEDYDWDNESHESEEYDEDDDEYDEDGNRIPGPGRYIPPSARHFGVQAPRFLPRPVRLSHEDLRDDTEERLQASHDMIRAEYDAIRIQHERDVEAHIAVQAELAIAKVQVAEFTTQLSAAVEVYNRFHDEPAFMASRTAALSRVVQDLTARLATATADHDRIVIPAPIPQPPKKVTGNMSPSDLNRMWDKFRADMEVREDIKRRKTAARERMEDLTARLAQAQTNLRTEQQRLIRAAESECDRIYALLQDANARVADLSARDNAPEVNEVKMSVMRAELDHLREQIIRVQRRGCTVLGKDFVEEYDDNGDLIKKTSTACLAELRALDFNPPMKDVDGWMEDDHEAYRVMREAILAKYPEPEVEKQEAVVERKQTKAISMADHLKFLARHH